MQHVLNDPDGSASQNVTVHVINVCTGHSLRSLPMRGQRQTDSPDAFIQIDEQQTALGVNL